MKTIKHHPNWNFGCYKVDDKTIQYPKDLNVEISDNTFLEAYRLDGFDYDHGIKHNWSVNALRTYVIINNEKYYKDFDSLDINENVFSSLLDKGLFILKN